MKISILKVILFTCLILIVNSCADDNVVTRKDEGKYKYEKIGRTIRAFYGDRKVIPESELLSWVINELDKNDSIMDNYYSPNSYLTLQNSVLLNTKEEPYPYKLNNDSLIYEYKNQSNVIAFLADNGNELRVCTYYIKMYAPNGSPVGIYGGPGEFGAIAKEVEKRIASSGYDHLVVVREYIYRKLEANYKAGN